MLFDGDRSHYSADDRYRHAMYELAFTVCDFSAAILFVIGSVMFFWESLSVPATWCFLVGSIFFALKPTIRTVREIHLAADGDIQDLAKRLKG